MKRGFFITFEGPEGGGKSTHSRQLASWLKRRGHSVLWTREPGGTPLGMKLRKILLDSRHDALDPFLELLLYEANRALLVREAIRPALKTGKVVIADRFQDSTWVYQSWAGGIDRLLVEELGRAATGGLKPDLTILLDLPVRKGLARVRRPNRMEAKSLAFHTKVRQGFLELARRHRKRFRVVPADRPIREVTQAIRKEVADVLC